MYSDNNLPPVRLDAETLQPTGGVDVSPNLQGEQSDEGSLGDESYGPSPQIDPATGQPRQRFVPSSGGATPRYPQGSGSAPRQTASQEFGRRYANRRSNRYEAGSSASYSEESFDPEEVRRKALENAQYMVRVALEALNRSPNGDALVRALNTLEQLDSRKTHGVLTDRVGDRLTFSLVEIQPRSDEILPRAIRLGDRDEPNEPTSTEGST